MGLQQTSAPASEPVTTAEAKTWARVDTSADDTLIDAMVAGARAYCEMVTQRQFVTATWTYTLDEFPDEVLVPFPPLASVTSLGYTDTDGAPQTLVENTDFQIDTTAVPGRIKPEYATSWPGTRREFNAVSLVYVAGYGAAAAVPEGIKTAIKMIVAHWYNNRESVYIGPGSPSVIPQGVNELLWQFRHMDLRVA